MAWFALIQPSSDDVIQVVDGEKRFRSGLPPGLKPDKDLKWLPYVKVYPPFNNSTQIRTGPVDTVTDTDVTREWTVRNKTAQELDDDKDNQVLSKMKWLKPLMLALNDGSFVPGQNLSNAKLKAIIKDHI
jgi:hypothetical protein